MITRDESLKIIEENVSNKNIIKHMLATEVMMKTLAKKFEPGNVEEWGMAGLLHDGDYSLEVPIERQGIQIAEWAEEKGCSLPEGVKHAMAAHNWHNNNVEPKSKMDWSLFCGDSLTGLVVASALVLPSKKLADLTTDSVLKRFKETGFARGTRREDIKMCEEKLGLTLEEFVTITLKAMQDIAKNLGL